MNEIELKELEVQTKEYELSEEQSVVLKEIFNNVTKFEGKQNLNQQERMSLIGGIAHRLNKNWEVGDIYLSYANVIHTAMYKSSKIDIADISQKIVEAGGNLIALKAVVYGEGTENTYGNTYVKVDGHMEYPPEDSPYFVIDAIKVKVDGIEVVNEKGQLSWEHNKAVDFGEDEDDNFLVGRQFSLKNSSKYAKSTLYATYVVDNRKFRYIEDKRGRRRWIDELGHSVGRNSTYWRELNDYSATDKED